MGGCAKGMAAEMQILGAAAAACFLASYPARLHVLEGSETLMESVLGFPCRGQVFSSPLAPAGTNAQTRSLAGAILIIILTETQTRGLSPR